MRIVHIITRLIIGGAQENTLFSCEGQHDGGHDVTLVTGPALGPEGSLLDRAKSYGYRVVVVDAMRRAIHPWRDAKVYFQLVKLLRDLGPDVVHTHSSKAGIIGRWAARRAGVRAIVHTIHGLAFTASTSRLINTAYRFLEKWTAPITTRIVCVADAMRDQSLAGGVGRPEQYVTIYSGMETADFLHPPVARERVRNELGLAPRHVAVGTIARLFHLKGHDDLLDLAPQLCLRFPDLRFLWVGEGILRESFEARMRAMGLRDRFILSGLVPPARIPELANAMDILVHPSRREGLARALAQGALAGKPTITYDIDGNREGLLDGRSGFVVAAFDQGQLAEKLAILLEDPELRRRFGEEGRRFALARFDAKAMVQRLDSLYHEIVHD